MHDSRRRRRGQHRQRQHPRAFADVSQFFHGVRRRYRRERVHTHPRRFRRRSTLPRRPRSPEKSLAPRATVAAHPRRRGLIPESRGGDGRVPAPARGFELAVFGSLRGGSAPRHVGEFGEEFRVSVSPRGALRRNLRETSVRFPRLGVEPRRVLILPPHLRRVRGAEFLEPESGHRRAHRRARREVGFERVVQFPRRRERARTRDEKPREIPRRDARGVLAPERLRGVPRVSAHVRHASPATIQIRQRLGLLRVRGDLRARLILRPRRQPLEIGASTRQRLRLRLIASAVNLIVVTLEPRAGPDHVRGFDVHDVLVLGSKATHAFLGADGLELGFRLGLDELGVPPHDGDHLVAGHAAGVGHVQEAEHESGEG